MHSITKFTCALTLSAFLPTHVRAADPLPPNQVQTANGILQGVTTPDGQVRAFKGVPYAAAPVGNLRWKPPQPAANWSGARQAADFGARCMQGNIFGDMKFRDSGPSEDCLYLNVWTPAKPTQTQLPVMVWIYGGGFMAGATSEPRQDGSNLTKKGVLVVSMNYRLGVFGFFTHPDLTKESAHNASGNYGLLDQVAALQWVHDNIALFGGDPANVTIFGESAGSFSVSALVASPLTLGLFHKAIGESGSLLGDSLPPLTLANAETQGAKFAQLLGAPTLISFAVDPGIIALRTNRCVDNDAAGMRRMSSPMRSFSVETSISASPERIWGLLTDAAGYSRWNSTVERVEGKITAGERVVVRTKTDPKRAFPVRVSEFAPPLKMTWTGGMPLGLFKGQRTFRLKPGLQSGVIQFSMREEYTGLMAPLIVRSIPDLQPAFNEFASDLKRATEMR